MAPVLRPANPIGASGYADVFCLSTLLSIIAARVADTSVTRRDPFKSARAIARALDDSQTDMYLVVHNLDGPRFRTPKIQTTLSILASSPRIRVLASIDHCRVPLRMGHCYEIAGNHTLIFLVQYGILPQRVHSGLST